ncbi:MAG: hypothetical protein ACE37J_18880 [Pikeienuella sp.]|uniref:hypothetical protein n=1 Tax=Pikeienuella sp. TaxID=2831957 RepID=UPI003918F040
MAAALRAGALYFAAIFALGFLLGVVRTLALAPRIGETGAVLAELPVILAASWFAAGRLARPLGRALRPRIAMGAFAFALLMAAEVGLGMALGAAPFAGLATPAGALGLAGQLLFAAFPALRSPRRS